ncbi:terminase small subunit [Epilithonimonas sp. UC225_85]|uniref:terminase small subunit n=1 Tax=Epilithonimonas sp. UC225_85 TaxID=3350167 RepID=UPI0036D352C9
MAAPKGNKYWQLAKGFAVGNEKAYTPQQLWKKAVEFLQWLDENPLKEEKVFGTGFKTEVSKMKAPTLSGFCIYAGIHTSTFNRYINNEDEAYRNIAKHIQDLFFAVKFEGAAADLMNPNIIARETGLSEKTESNQSGDVTITFK